MDLLESLKVNAKRNLAAGLALPPAEPRGAFTSKEQLRLALLISPRYKNRSQVPKLAQ